jgi:hypothetical protein
MTQERYLIKVVECFEPEVLGPYENERSRSKAARKIHKDMGFEDVLFALDTSPVRVWAYSSAFFTAKVGRRWNFLRGIWEEVQK